MNNDKKGMAAEIPEQELQRIEKIGFTCKILHVKTENYHTGTK